MIPIPPYTIVDLETENHEYYGMVAPPFCPENYIVEAGWKNNQGPVESKRFANREEQKASAWFDYAFDNGKPDSYCNVMVAHNATYELHWFMHDYMNGLMRFLRNGGKIWCTQYAEYLLSQQQDLYPDLNTTAPKYGGTPKVDEVKLLWEQGVMTSEIDPDLLHEYLCSDHGDVANTEKIFLGQWEEAQKRGMLTMIQQRMDALLFNAFCTFFGMHIDMNVAEKNLAKQEARLAELHAKVAEALPSDLPFEFKFSSDYQMSAWIYGGTIKYKTKVPYDPPKYVKKVGYMDKEGNFTEEPTADSIRYASGKNKGLPKQFKVDTDEELLKWGEKTYTFKGLVNLNELPETIKEQFIGERPEFAGKRFQVDGSPVFSTSADALASIKQYCNVVDELLEIAQLEKDNGTYYRRYEYDTEGNVKKVSGMLQYVIPSSSIIHHQLNACASRTGRLSSSRPNLQNLPRDGTSRVKEMFSSRFGTDGRCVEIDYSALEVVTLAAASNDKNLITQLENGTDMHCYRLAGALNEPYEEVYEKCHNEEHPEHKKYKELRTAIKPRAFAAQYGASAGGIAFATGCTLQEAEQFLETEAKLFPESRAFKDKVRAMVEETGRLPESIERELDPETGAWYVFHRGYYKAPGGTEYSFRQRKQWKDHKEVLDYKDTEISNYPIQGEGAFIVQVACGRIIRWLIKENFFDWSILPINTVHDAVYIDCKSEDLAKRGGKAVAWIMGTTPKYITTIIPEYKAWMYDEVPFPAVPEMGYNLYDKTHVE